MLDMQRIHDTSKVYIGSVVGAGGGFWSWLGHNHQQIGAILGILGILYATIAFVQSQLDRHKREKADR